MRNSERWTSRLSSPGRLLVMIGRPCAGLRQQLLLKFSSVIAWASSWAWLEYGSSWSTHSFAGEPGSTGKGPPQPPMPVSFMFEIVNLSWVPAAQTAAAGIRVAYSERKAVGAQVCWGRPSESTRRLTCRWPPVHVPLAAGVRAAVIRPDGVGGSAAMPGRRCDRKFDGSQESLESRNGRQCHRAALLRRPLPASAATVRLWGGMADCQRQQGPTRMVRPTNSG